MVKGCGPMARCDTQSEPWQTARNAIWLQGLVCLLLVWLGAGVPEACAGDYYVAKWGKDVQGDGSSTAPWCTVQHAIDSITGSMEDPHAIHISGGIYVENVRMDSWESLYGGYDPMTWQRDVDGNPTILQATAVTSDSAVVQAASGSILSGCTVTGGYYGIYCKHASSLIERNTVAHNVFGIVCQLESSPLILENRITSNTLNGVVCEGSSSPSIVGNHIADNGGDGIVLRRSRALVRENTIQSNQEIGIYVAASDPVIESNEIVGNGEDGTTLFLTGGRIEANRFIGNHKSGLTLSYSDAAVMRNQFVRNGTWGLGVLFSFPPAVENNVMLQNDIGVYCSQYSSFGLLNATIAYNVTFGVAASYFSNVFSTNCIIWENADDLVQCEASYSCISDGDPGEGNISMDPRFVNSEDDDLHLAWDSPCIDAGTSVGAPRVDYEGDPRPRGMGFDIGADESFRRLKFDFAQGEQGWTFHAPDGPFAPCAGEVRAEGLALLADAKMPSFGFWQSPAAIVPAFPDSLYRVRWHLREPGEDSGQMPPVRLRVSAESLHYSNDLMLQQTSGGSESEIAGEHTNVYDFYCVLLVPGGEATGDAENQFLAFDLLSLDPVGMPGSGAVMEMVEVERIGLAALSDARRLRTYTFEQSSEGWHFSGPVGPFTPPLSGYGNGALFLSSITNTNTFGFWANDPADLALAGGAKMLYRTTFTLYSDQEDGAVVPQVRLRMGTRSGNRWVIQTISSVGDGEYSPGRSPLRYTLYYPWSGGAAPDSLQLGFDLLNFDSNDVATGTIYLDEVLVEEMDLPLIE